LNSRIIQYLSEQVVIDIRNGVVFDSGLTAELCQEPYINHIRKLILEIDLKFLNLYMNDSDKSKMQFGFALLQNIKHLPEVRKVLEDRWITVKSFEERKNIMYRLLDYSDLTMQYKIEIWNFVIEYWDEWVADFLKFNCQGEMELVLSAFESRLNDNRFPKSKHWIYLLSASVSPNKQGLIQLFNRYYNSSDPMQVRVKELLKDKISF